MAEPQQLTIDGATYSIGTLPPRRSLRLQNRLLRAIGPAIAQLIASVKPGPGGKVALGEVDLVAISAGVQGLMAQLTPDEQDAIMAELLAPVSVVQDGRSAPVMAVFDAHFEGRLPAVYKLMWAALELNFGTFIGPLVGAARTAGAVFLSKASSVTPPSGQSGV
jgi:hypothetical protein